MPILPWMKMSMSGERSVEPGSAWVAPASIIFLICSAPGRFAGSSTVISVGVAERAAAAPEPHGRLGLRLLGAERHAVARDAAAEGGDLGGRVEELVPGGGRRCDAGLLEQGVVDEQRSRRRDERQRVGRAVDLGVGEERLLEVAVGLGRHDLLGWVEQFVGGEAGEGTAVVDVGCLAALDLRGDDALEVVPRLHLEVHRDVGVLLLETGDDVFPEALGVVGVARDEQVEGGAPPEASSPDPPPKPQDASVSEAVAARATAVPRRRDFFMDASSLWWMVHLGADEPRATVRVLVGRSCTLAECCFLNVSSTKQSSSFIDARNL